MTAWHIAAGPGVAAVSAIVLALCFVTVWRSGRSGGRRSQASRWLVTLGVCGMALLALRPEREAAIDAAPRRVVLLRDVSGSMDTPDGAPDGRPRGAVAAALATELRTRSGAQTSCVERIFGAPAGTVGGTDLHEAILGALADAPTAIVLLSDGDANAGSDSRLAARAAAQAGVPLFTICLGRSEPLPTLGVTDWTVPDPCPLGDLAVLTARLANALPQAWEGEVTVSAAAGRRVASRRVRLDAGQARLVGLRWRPERPGPQTLTVSLPVPPGDAVSADNLRTASVRVSAEPLRVLAVDRQPRWEFRHAVAAWRSGGAARVQTLLLDPALRPADVVPADLRGEDVAAEDSAPDRLAAFPPRAELASLSAVLLGAVPCDGGNGALSEQAAADVRWAVEEAGLGLILLPGAAAGPASWFSSPLAPLLPVQPGSAPADRVIRTRTPSPLRLLPDARFSALAALGPEPDDDATIWRRLPGLQRFSRCGDVRPGSTALVALGDPGGGLDVPLVVFRRVGLGRVLYVGSDQFWRWRSVGEADAHERFWQAAVRLVARPSGATAGSPWRVLVEGTPASLGSPVALHAVPSAGVDLGTTGPLRCLLRCPGGPEVRVDLTPREPGQTVWSGSVVLPQSGVWEVYPNGVAAAAATVAVLAGPVEAVGAVARPELLDALALLTGGRRFSPEETEAIADAVSAARAQATVVRRHRLWTHPAWVGSVVVLLGLGLALRGSTQGCF